jgi:ABC-type Fe3+/spermidine/putrescine transport system ATPase subunit
MGTMAGVLELRGVSKHFPGHAAVTGVSLEVPQGEFFSLLGPSGCGKTTTLRLVAGFETPTSGAIFLNGQPIHELKPYERNVSTVFQNYALFPHLTVRGNIEFGLRRGPAAHDIAGRVQTAIEMVRLSGKERRYPHQMSGGEKQRAALARSLVLEPDVLLLDEPLSALDPNLRKQVRGELKQLQRRVGITFLFVTHDQEEALSMSDRIAVMNAGRIEQVGTPEELYLTPASRFVASFLGEVNWIDGIGVRPESVRVSKCPPAGVPQREATVTRSRFLGNRIHVESQCGSGEAVVAEMSRLDGGFTAGEPVHLWWQPSDELRFAD